MQQSADPVAVNTYTMHPALALLTSGFVASTSTTCKIGVMQIGRTHWVTVRPKDSCTLAFVEVAQGYDGTTDPTAWITALMAPTLSQNAVQNTNLDRRFLKHGITNARTAANQQTP
jgi:hypothetical protein